MDKDKFTRDDEIGRVTYYLNEIKMTRFYSGTLRIDHKNVFAGELVVNVEYFSDGT